MEIKITERLKAAYPAGQLATLIVRNAINKNYDERLEREKRALEEFIRVNYQEPDKLRRVQEYNNFYRKLEGTFPIEYQLRSILAGNQIPAVSCLVEVMFMNELRHCCLTAGHDLEAIQGDLILDLAEGNESYIKINDQEQTIKKGDIILKDQVGIVASVFYGPDSRTKIISISRNIIYMNYFLFKIERAGIISIMADLTRLLKITEGPHAQIEKMNIFS